MNWINVKDQLPESDSGDVIVTNGEGCSIAEYDECNSSWSGGKIIHAAITHWMHLPEPPLEP